MHFALLPFPPHTALTHTTRLGLVCYDVAARTPLPHTRFARGSRALRTHAVYRTRVAAARTRARRLISSNRSERSIETRIWR